MITRDGWKEFIRATILDAGNTCKVFLAKADFSDASSALVWTDLTEADFPGYARQVYNDGSGVPDLSADPWGRFLSATFTFQPVSIVTPQTIYGIGVLKVVSAVTKLIVANKFDAPVVLSSDSHKVERGIDFYSRSFTP